jgi:hypothetical protein
VHRSPRAQALAISGLDTKLQVASEAVPQSQPSWSGSALCLLFSHTSQSRRSHRAVTDSRPRRLRDRTQHHVAGSVSVRWRTLWKSAGRPCTVRHPIAGRMPNSASCSPELPKCTSEKLFAKMYFLGSACEAQLVSPSDDQIAASETKAGSAHTAHDPALVSPGPTGLRLNPDKGMHSAGHRSRTALSRMHRNHEIVCNDCHSLPLKR